MRTGIACGGAVMALSVAPVWAIRNMYKDDSNPLRRLQWLVVMGVMLAVASFVADLVQDKLYQITMVRLNKQHFANVHWLKQYQRALLQ